MQASETPIVTAEKPKKRARRTHHDHARDGISIEDVWKTCGRRSGKRYLARVRDPRTKTYIRQMFDERAHAEKWATQERAALGSKVRRWLEKPTLSKTPRRDGKQVVARNTPQPLHALARTGAPRAPAPGTTDDSITAPSPEMT